MICSIEFLEENDWIWRRLDRFLMLFENNEWLLRYSPADNGYIPNKRESCSARIFQTILKCDLCLVQIILLRYCTFVGNIAKSVDGA